MRKKHTLLKVLILLLIVSPVLAVNTSKIDAVRNKETLADADTTIIEEFLKDAFSEFFSKTDFSDIASLRNVIISKSTSSIESGQILYGPKFSSVIKKELASTLKKTNALKDSFRKTVLTTNLLILINDLSNIEASKLSLDYLQNPGAVIRYWAVNSLTNANILRQLNEGSEGNRNDIAQKLLKAAQAEQSSDILIILAQFASALKAPSANEILAAIAKKRTDLYMSGQVNDEMTEEWILKALIDRIETDADSSKQMAKDFSILYSLAIQRYAAGEQSLNATSKSNLVSVIIQSEKLLVRFVPDWNGNFKRAIEKGGSAGLIAESDALFGSAAAAGKLPSAAGFDYGKNADGSAKTAPPELQKP